MQLTSDQRELQDLVRRFFQDSVPSEYLRKRITSLLRRDPGLLESLKQLGLKEGFGGDTPVFSFAELALVSEEIGRALFPEPLGESLLGEFVVPQILSASTRSEYEQLGVSGTAFAPPACCKLVLDLQNKKVSGEVVWAPGVEGASRLIVSVGEGEKRHLLAIRLDQPGVTTSPVSSLDLTIAISALSLNDATAVVFTRDESMVVNDCYEILKAAEVYGITSRAIEMTVEYVKTREQFGVPVGAFQAIQQRVAEAFATSESLGALCRFAAWSVKSSPEQRALTARAAVSHASEVGPSVCEAMIQCHGGIGFTWEYDLHLYLRRARTIQAGFSLTTSRVDELLARAAAG